MSPHKIKVFPPFRTMGVFSVFLPLCVTSIDAIAANGFIAKARHKIMRSASAALDKGFLGAGIPKQVYATVPSSIDAELVEELRKNIEEVAGFSAEQLHIFTDEQMNASAHMISAELEKAGVKSSYEAFAALRPGAFKADLWRYMVLWSAGGIYLDESIRLLKPFDSWLNLDDDRLVIVKDSVDNAYWNAMMASMPKHPALLPVIATAVYHVQEHFYGTDALQVTGPKMLFQALSGQLDNGVKVKLQLKQEVTPDCGGFPQKACNETVVHLDNEQDVVATKDYRAHTAVHHEAHYSNLWNLHQVYCDEPSAVACEL